MPVAVLLVAHVAVAASSKRDCAQKLVFPSHGRGYIVRQLEHKGGLGNKLILLWRSLAVAALLDRKLWVHTGGSDILPYIRTPGNLGGFLTWTEDPPAADIVERKYSSVMPAAQSSATTAAAVQSAYAARLPWLAS